MLNPLRTSICFLPNRCRNEPFGALSSRLDSRLKMNNVFEVSISLEVESTIWSVRNVTLSVLIAAPRKFRLKKRKRLKNENTSLRWACGDRLWSTNRTRAKLFKELLACPSLGRAVLTTATISRYPITMKLRSGRLWNKNEERSSVWVLAFRNWPAWRLERWKKKLNFKIVQFKFQLNHELTWMLLPGWCLQFPDRPMRVLSWSRPGPSDRFAAY